MGVVQGVRHLPRYLQRVFDREHLLPVDAVRQGFALYQRHYVIEETGGLAGIVKGQDVGMAQLGGNLDLAQESLGAEGSREFRPEHLDGYLAVVLDIPSQEHDRHATGTEFPLEFVLVGKSRSQPL